MNRVTRHLTLIVMLGSLHFGICVGIAWGAEVLSLSGWKLEAAGWLIRILGFPAFQILEQIITSSLPLVLLIGGLSSLLWGCALVPLALFLKNRFLLRTTDH